MKYIFISILLSFLFLIPVSAQNQQGEIDSLVKMMRTAGREWNDYANPLIKIGEPAVPALIKNAEDKSLPQWNRRISMEVLNNIHSPQWKQPALNILFDKTEDPDLRNRATGGLRGFDLSDVKDELWEIYNEVENEFYKSNLAYLLLTADTALAYKAFLELYQTRDGHIQKNALLNLAQLRPKESIDWFLKGIQIDDWMTANLAMDSLINLQIFNANELISLFNKTNTSEETQWRIVYVLGHRNEPDNISFLIQAIQNESWLVHNEAAVGLSRFDKDQVLKYLTALNRSPKPFVKRNVKWVKENLKD